jgi:hypothetical protein
MNETIINIVVELEGDFIVMRHSDTTSFWKMTTAEAHALELQLRRAQYAALAKARGNSDAVR